MTRTTTALAALLAIAPLVAQDPPVAERPAAGTAAKWRALFNGRDLTGWIPKIRGHAVGVNHADTFRVEDGILRVAYDGYETFDERFGHLFHDTEFASYRLRVEYRFVGEQCPGGPGWAFRNSGVMVHGQPPQSMGLDQSFPASIEVQLLGGRERGERTTANLCTPGTDVVFDGKLHRRHCTNSTSKTYRGDRWVTAEIEVRGNRIRHFVEGEQVLEYRDPQLDDRDGDARKLLAAGAPKMLRHGTISLQSESHPVEFRKVEILELEPPDDGWTDLLASGELATHWAASEGNWQLGRDGVVTLTPRAGEKGWARFGAYLWLREEYGDFEIEFDYRVAKRGNSGFYFRVGDRQNPVRNGIEVQIFDSHGERGRLGDHDSGGIIPGIPPTANPARPAGEWNRFHITSLGQKLTVRLNGVVVNEVDLGQGELARRPARGSIGFQDHALPLALRRIRIRALQ